MFAIEIIDNNECILSVKFNGDNTDAFRKLFDQWSDVAFLYDFFEENKEDLNSGFFGSISIEYAVQFTLEKAIELRKKLMDIVSNANSDNHEQLQNIFKPLHNEQQRVYPPETLEKSKAYGLGSKNWLRIYALRIDSNTYLVTGGAIKLTETMNERQHTINELDKLNQVREFLIENGYIDGESPIDFLELE